MAFPPLDDPALGIAGEVERAERHALVDRYLIPDLARLTDHHPGPMVDEEAPPDARPGMDVDAGTRVGVLAHDARADRHALRMEDVRQSIHRSRLKTRVGEDDLLERLRGRIAVVGRLDVGPQDGTNVRDLGEQLQGCRLRLGAAVLAVGGRDGASALEAQSPLDLCAESPGDRARTRHRACREVGRDEVARLEVSGEEHAQQILHHAPDDLAAREGPAFEVGELSLPRIAREDRGDTVVELASGGRGGHGVTTLDRLLPDVGLDETEILVHPPPDLRADIRSALVAGLVGLIGGVTGRLTIGGRRGRERGDAKGTVGYLTSIGDSFPASDPSPWTPGTIWRDTGARPGEPRPRRATGRTSSSKRISTSRATVPAMPAGARPASITAIPAGQPVDG